MKPKLPQSCPFCSRTHNITMLSLTSRVFALWRHEMCGGEWTADAATGRLIARKSSAQHLEGEVRPT